jgi:hypothetical protein
MNDGFHGLLHVITTHCTDMIWCWRGSQPLDECGGCPVTKKDLVVVASRAFAMYLIIWALSDLSNVSIDVFVVRHYSALPGEYIYKYHRMELYHRLGMIVALSLAATWFYKCGLVLERFFSPDESQTAE